MSFAAAILGMQLLSACVLTQSRKSDAESAPVAIHTYTLSDNGLFVVRVRLNEDLERDFIVDTGSTMTTITRSVAEELGLWSPDAPKVMIHGFFESGERPVTMLDEIRMGPLARRDLPVAVLDDSAKGADTRNLLGLDFFEGYAIEFAAGARELRLHPREGRTAPAVEAYRRSVDLEDNPYGGPASGLLFTRARLNGRWTPVLIDTGAAFSVLNWEAAKDWRLALVRRDQERAWRAQGAIGEFKPRAAVRYGSLRLGDWEWRDQTLTVFDLRTQELLGAPGAPILIAGTNLFAETWVLIDPVARRLYLGDGAALVAPCAPSGGPIRMVERATRFKDKTTRFCGTTPG